MAEYVLSCCSTVDLTKKLIEEDKLSYVPFHFSLGGKEYEDDFGETIKYSDLYARMKNGEETKTSQVTVGEYINYFEKFLVEGKDILHLTLSSGLSGTYNSALKASQTLQEKYPDRKVYIVDSLCASSGYGLLMDKLAELKEEGMSIEELRNYAESHKLNVQHWFLSTDLSFYVKGGRLKKSSAFFASLLHICPVLDMNKKGQLILKEKPITSKLAIAKLVKKMEIYAEGNADYAGKVFICHSICENYAKSLKEKVLTIFHKLKDENISIFPIGTTIGSHTGPGTCAIFFFGQKRAD